MSDTFAITSDYLNDFNSLRFSDKNSFYLRFMGEFYSRTAQLRREFCKEKKKEDGYAYRLVDLIN